MVRNFLKLDLIVALFVLVFASAGLGQDQGKVQELRILTYNIHHGEGMDRQLDLARIAKTINSVKPDLVALQEVDVETDRSMKVNQAKELSRLTNRKYAFGSNLNFSNGRYGNCFLSKHEIKDWKNHQLPNHRNGEQRGLLHVTVQLVDLKEPVHFWVTHFDHRKDDSERVASAKFCNQMLEKTAGSSQFLAGDINDVIGSSTLSELEKSWDRSNYSPLPTVPVGKPTRQIDFVFNAKKSGWTCVSTKILSESVASDHRAVLAVYRMSGTDK